MAVKKRSIALDPDVAASAAEISGQSLSAWLNDAARTRLRVEDGLAAVAEWEAERGPLTAEERSVVLVARSRRAAIVTSDEPDIRHLMSCAGASRAIHSLSRRHAPDGRPHSPPPSGRLDQVPAGGGAGQPCVARHERDAEVVGQLRVGPSTSRRL